jgi:hypothetical protein
MTTLTPTATAEQAAAIVAAIERFTRERTPPRISGEEHHDPWMHAAILEGVAREDPELAFPAPA